MLMMKNYKWISGVLFGVAFDQGIKIFISTLSLNRATVILENLLYFEPVQNTEYSYINQLLSLGVERSTHIIINILAIIILYLVFNAFCKENISSITLTISQILLFSGAICSLLDKTIWNGSLDFIRINGLFTFDLKDVYIQLGVIALLINWRRVRHISIFGETIN